MSGTSLRDFVLRAVEHKRKRFGDLRRLQRDILPARITTPEQAKVLIALASSANDRFEMHALSRRRSIRKSCEARMRISLAFSLPGKLYAHTLSGACRGLGTA